MTYRGIVAGLLFWATVSAQNSRLNSSDLDRRTAEMRAAFGVPSVSVAVVEERTGGVRKGLWKRGFGIESTDDNGYPVRGRFHQQAVHSGGMTHLSYRAHFERNSVLLNIYVRPDGRFEQFLVEEQF